jgi:hypothetical protein
MTKRRFVMPTVTSTFPSAHAQTRVENRTFKAVLVGLATVVGLVLVTLGQISVDRTAADIEPDQTTVAARSE